MGTSKWGVRIAVLVSAIMKENYQPTRKGLDNLNISGSAEMSLNEFKVTVDTLKKIAKGPIYDMDLRQESHGYFDGQAVSWYGLRDWGNVDKKDDVKAILKDERDRLHGVVGNAQTGEFIPALNCGLAGQIPGGNLIRYPHQFPQGCLEVLIQLVNDKEAEQEGHGQQNQCGGDVGAVEGLDLRRCICSALLVGFHGPCWVRNCRHR